MPDEGIFMTTAIHPSGPWSPLHLVKEVKGWIDPCPLWDDDGQAYLVHGFAKSRSGIKSKLQICKMSVDGRELLDNGQIVYDGTVDNPTIEGPKLYKRNGYYYIFAPAGGVETGWQLVLRSNNIWGPYDCKIVLHQGDTVINGPHQGGYVELDSGESWFIHFQDREAYGRIVHLQPMSWVDDWPIMGVDTNGDGIGEPVLRLRKPNVGANWPVAVPQANDDFNEAELGLQWQWQANRKPEWHSLEARPGWLRLYGMPVPGDGTLFDAPNVLCQKFAAPAFTATAKLSLPEDRGNFRAGLTVLGHRFRSLSFYLSEQGITLALTEGEGKKGEASRERIVTEVTVDGPIENWLLRLKVSEGALCTLQYSKDSGTTFHPLGDEFKATAGGWVGAKVGLFCLAMDGSASDGYADFDWIVFE
jgi:beta-xylosidase